MWCMRQMSCNYDTSMIKLCQNIYKQECIPVGFVPSAAVAVSGGGVSVPGGVWSWGGLLWRGVCSQGDFWSWGLSAPGGCLLWGVFGPGGVCLLWGEGVYSGGVWSWGLSAPGGVCFRGVSAPGGRGSAAGGVCVLRGVSALGGVVSQHALRQTSSSPLWTDTRL